MLRVGEGACCCPACGLQVQQVMQKHIHYCATASHLGMPLADAVPLKRCRCQLRGCQNAPCVPHWISSSADATPHNCCR